ncbi:hypothetical protein [Entomospira culicis]|uniref:Uncharacterized protein n=1 Tax=Entomospira culicis TaxID=2719989 RepID=A0A968KWA2_9SPIO|nr:hypothetical protein [Entomospira culicis]NIZ18747.1 hypothetical protein [Entomospira culicis]NIZ68962.1 hypothetical protein [Entomospira culicis]WDI37554.1 hypothetical protein PVA46_01840 [Entomospira culicis]WDI39182.1 hypothetical protein PVA47_01845 [Entomospira culicis]
MPNKFIIFSILLLVAGCASSPKEKEDSDSNTTPSSTQSTEASTHQRPNNDVNYGVLYYAIQAPASANASIPQGNFDDTIPAFEQSLRDQGIFIFKAARRVISYRNDTDTFIVDYATGQVSRQIAEASEEEPNEILLNMHRANGSNNFDQWSINDSDIKALNATLKSAGLEQAKSGDAIKVLFIIRSSSSEQARTHYIQTIKTLSYTLN